MDRNIDLNETVKNISSIEVYDWLNKEKNTYLIDVRTEQEWIQVGYPSSSNLVNECIKLSWREFPNMDINLNFTHILLEKIPDITSKLFFICKSGARSFEAAQAMNNLGYKNCYNIIDGFEGSYLDKKLLGWKLSNLPWER